VGTFIKRVKSAEKEELKALVGKGWKSWRRQARERPRNTSGVSASTGNLLPTDLIQVFKSLSISFPIASILRNNVGHFLHLHLITVIF